MLSYHRILKAFGRSVNDKTLECDCDIHAWEITVNSETSPGNIRLIGFVDVLFIISYSANDSIRGIIIYKDSTALEVLKEKNEQKEQAEKEKAQQAQEELREQEEGKEQNHRGEMDEQMPADESMNGDPTEYFQANGAKDTDVEFDDDCKYYHSSSDSGFDSDSTDDEGEGNGGGGGNDEVVEDGEDLKKEEEKEENEKEGRKTFQFKERSVYTIRSPDLEGYV